MCELQAPTRPAQRRKINQIEIILDTTKQNIIILMKRNARCHGLMTILYPWWCPSATVASITDLMASHDFKSVRFKHTPHTSVVVVVVIKYVRTTTIDLDLCAVIHLSVITWFFHTTGCCGARIFCCCSYARARHCVVVIASEGQGSCSPGP